MLNYCEGETGPLLAWPSCGILLLKFRIQPLLPIDAVAFCRRGHFQCAKLMRHHLPTAELPFLQYFSHYLTDPPPQTYSYIIPEECLITH